MNIKWQIELNTLIRLYHYPRGIQENANGKYVWENIDWNVKWNIQFEVLDDMLSFRGYKLYSIKYAHGTVVPSFVIFPMIVTNGFIWLSTFLTWPAVNITVNKSNI